MKRFIFWLTILWSEPLRLALFSRLGLSTDWLLGLLILAALTTKPPRGAAIGFVLGAGRDLLYGQPIGFEALLLCATAWLVGGTGRTVYRDAFTTQALMVFVASIVHSAAVYLKVVGSPAGLLPYLWHATAAGAVLTSIGIPLGYYVVCHLLKPKLSEDIQALLRESQIKRSTEPRF